MWISRLTYLTIIAYPRATPYKEESLKLPVDAGDEEPFYAEQRLKQCPGSPGVSVERCSQLGWGIKQRREKVGRPVRRVTLL